MTTTRLAEEFDQALGRTKGLHASNVSQDYLALFIRVGKESPDKLLPVIEQFERKMKVHRSNIISALFAVAKIADVSEATRQVVKKVFTDDLVNYYMEDEDNNIATNAQILERVLKGEPFSRFEEKPKKKEQTLTNIYNLANSNLAINSPSASQSVAIKYDDLNEDVRAKLDELDEAINKQDKSKVAKILTFLTDKAFDVMVALITGQLIK